MPGEQATHGKNLAFRRLHPCHIRCDEERGLGIIHPLIHLQQKRRTVVDGGARCGCDDRRSTDPPCGWLLQHTMPLLKLRGAGSTRRRSQQRLANGFYDDDEDELEVVSSNRKGHSVDNATYVSVADGVFKRVDIGSEDGSTGTKEKKVTIVGPPVRTDRESPPNDADSGYVTSLMKWLALDEDKKQSETDEDASAVRMYHGVEPYAEPTPVRTIKPPTGKLARPTSPLPSTMRQPSRPRPTLSPDQLGRASSPRRPVSPPPRPLSPTRRYESQRPASPPPRQLQSDPPHETKKPLNKPAESVSSVVRSSSHQPTRPPSIDLTSKKTKKPRVKQSPVVPVQSNRVRSSHRPFDHPSKPPSAFNRGVSARAQIANAGTKVRFLLSS
jgi:hypothetical protein